MPGTETTSKNVATGATTTLGASTGLTTVNLSVGMWTGGPPDPKDFLVLQIQPIASSAGATTGFQFASKWSTSACSGTSRRPTSTTSTRRSRSSMTDSTGANAVPATFENGAWRQLPALAVSGTLPVGMEDGYWRDGSTVHVLTRHLTMFGLLAAAGNALQIAAPLSVGGVVADDGLTVRWLPGLPSDQIGNYFLYVDGQRVQTSASVSSRPSSARSRRAIRGRFTMTETNLAGQESAASAALRACRRSPD